MKFWIHLLATVLCSGVIAQNGYSFSSSELIIPPSSRATGPAPSMDSSVKQPLSREYISEPKTTLKKDANELYNFTVKSLDGKYTHLGNYKGKIIVVNFWESTCLPSYMELFKIDELAYFDKKRQIVIICVAEDDESLLLKYKDKAPRLSFPLFTYDHADLPEELDHDYVPSTYIISQEGKIVLAKSGIIEGYQLWEEIKKLFPKEANAK